MKERWRLALCHEQSLQSLGPSRKHGVKVGVQVGVKEQNLYFDLLLPLLESYSKLIKVLMGPAQNSTLATFSFFGTWCAKISQSHKNRFSFVFFFAKCKSQVLLPVSQQICQKIALTNRSVLFKK